MRKQELIDRIAELEREVEDVCRSEMSASADADALRRERDTLRTQIESLKIAFRAGDEKLFNTRRLLEAAEKHATSRDDAVRSLHDELEQCKTTVKELSVTIESREGHITAIRKHNEELKTKLSGLSLLDATAAEAEVAKLREELRATNGVLNRVAGERSKCRDEAFSLSGKIDSLTNELARQDMEIDSVKGENERLRESIKTKEALVDEIRSANHKLASQAGEAEGRAATAEMKVSAVEELNEIARARVADANSQRDKLRVIVEAVLLMGPRVLEDIDR